MKASGPTIVGPDFLQLSFSNFYCIVDNFDPFYYIWFSTIPIIN